MEGNLDREEEAEVYHESLNNLKEQ